MRYSTKSGNAGEFRTDCLVVTPNRAQKVVRGVNRTILDRTLATVTPAHGRTIRVALDGSVKQLLVVGADEKQQSAEDFRKNAAAAANALRELAITNATWHLNDIEVTGHDSYWKARNAMAATSAAAYWFDSYKSSKPTKPRLGRLAIHVDGRNRSATQRAVRHAQALDAGMHLARDLGNHPPNVCNPTYLAREARKLRKDAKTTVSVLEERQMTDLGMGSFMSVTRGSDTPGKMIVIRYNGGRRGAAPVVLIGKGITFDTGGISLKPGAGMDEMKFDMAGAAAVLGTTKAAIEGKLPVNLVCIVAAAENMPSGQASRPGDIVTSMSGKTIEILNTDAEGRLVLCDAITYARRFKPHSVVDVATLTGAAVVALGAHAAALYANDDSLRGALESAGAYIHDRAWPMPLWDDYQQQLASPFADFANIGGRGAGSITAACFLSRFAEDMPWAHLDVAGTAYRGGQRKGSTGRPVPLLFQYLLDNTS